MSGSIAPGPGPLRAAVIDEIGAPPRLTTLELAERQAGTTVVRVLAAALNPLEIGIAAGLVPGLRHQQPYVPGIECVGSVVESDRFAVGDLVYGECKPSPRRPGCLATHVILEDDDLVAITAAIDPTLAVAAGNSGVAAFMPLIETAELREGETVLLLGATGAVGRLALQICREQGAGFVAAVGRNREVLDRLLHSGADAVVELRTGESTQQLADRLRQAVPPADVVFDGLFGAPLEAALQVCAPRARIVNIGNSAGQEATIPAGLLRAKQIVMQGFASILVPLSAKRPALEWLWSALAEGRIGMEVRTHSLDELPSAWRAQSTSPHTKLVILP